MSCTAKVNDEIRRLAAAVLRTDSTQIDDATPLVDYGLDSLRAMSLVVAIEQQFSLTITDNELERLHTTGDITEYVLRFKQ
jgi:acyl carrier protein